MVPDYAFRPMSSADLLLIRRWLATPEVVRWWGDPSEQFTLVSGDLDHPDMDQFIVALGERAFGYIQSYPLSTWNPGFGAQPTATRGIDQFIGEPDMIGCGHGSHFIRQFTDSLKQKGTPRIVTDPDPANIRAVRAYEKAGFRGERLVDTPDGRSLLTHCFAGKDRTGFMVALVLEAAGVERDAIMADFLGSNRAVPQLRDRILEAVRQRSDVEVTPELMAFTEARLSDEVLGVREEYLDTARRTIDENFGSLDGYLRSADITEADVARLRETLLG